MRNRAHLARLAGCGRSDDAPPGKEQCNQRRADEDRPIRLQYRQVADPCPAESQGDQNQRPQAAGRRKNGGQPTGEERAAPVLWFRHTLVLSNLVWIA
ncbi:conserved domain protein [Acinetobacter baumannii 6013113]|nr:conserved domain protein [Acinetobacter baumannii 6013113]